MTKDDHAQMVDTLTRAGYKVTPPPPPPPINTCAICGKTDDENDDEGFGPLVDARVIVSDGEEGFADVKRWYCNVHIDALAIILMGQGLGSHRHGGINYLDDETCLGYRDAEKCPVRDPDDDDGYVEEAR